MRATARLLSGVIPQHRPSSTFRLWRNVHVSQSAYAVTAVPSAPALRTFSSSRTTADEQIEVITELYATAKDEFDIAYEETEKSTVYAQSDRDAARSELERVKKVYNEIVDGTDRVLAEEVKRRVGHRIRELENGVKAMEEMAMSHD